MAKHIVLRAGGGGLFIMGMITVVLPVTIIYLAIHDGVAKGMSWSIVASLLIAAYFLVWFNGLLKNRVELTDTELTSVTLRQGRYIFPKFDENRVGLSNIASVSLGQMRYFDQKSAELNDPELNKVLEFWKNSFTPIRGGNLFFPMRIWVAARFTPLIVVRLKEGKSGVISTKPFSKNAVRALFAEFKRRNIPTEMQEGIL